MGGEGIFLILLPPPPKKTKEKEKKKTLMDFHAGADPNVF